MLHVKRDTKGRIVAVSQEDQGDGWEAISADAPELVSFISILAVEQKELVGSDLGLARVLEDLIELLMERDVVRFTDFPEVAQKKLLARRSIRSSLHSLKLLNENGGDDFL